MKASTAARLRLAFAVLAWLAQAFMPIAHAAVMGAPQAGHGVWCGDPASAQVALAALPADLRAALDGGGANADQLSSCALMCALGSAPPLAIDLPPAESVRAAGLEPAVAERCCPPSRPQSPTPPAHAPPRV